MPANEHLTMQIAQQLFGIETAQNGLIFFRNGEPAYITRRFDVVTDGKAAFHQEAHRKKDSGQAAFHQTSFQKLAVEDFSVLSGKTHHSHGKDYKYSGTYRDLFTLLKEYVPAYRVEAPKLLRRLLFNFLFSNGDAHLKNFSVMETPDGDSRLSPAYDLLNSAIHIQDSLFALSGGLLPGAGGQGKIRQQFTALASDAEFPKALFDKEFDLMTSRSDQVQSMISRSFLDESTKRKYWHTYQDRFNRLVKE